MMNFVEKLIRNFGLLNKASARKKVYSQKARQEGRPKVSHLLRAISESESIQARRLFNSLRGKIDTSEHYISTIFEKEIEETICEYSDCLRQAKKEEDKAMIQALSQLRAAEIRIKSFYSKESKDVDVAKVRKYYVCQFCGFINIEIKPDICPICGADNKSFREVF